MPYIGTSPSNGVRRVHTYTATASQTTFTGASSEGVTLSYVDTNYLDVFQNGVLLGSADYTSTSGTSVVLAQGASADDLVVIVVYDVFSVADTVSKSSGGTFDGAINFAQNPTVSSVPLINTPAFEAKLSSNQAFLDNVSTKVQFNTEEFDVGSCYDHSTNYRFTPNVAGKYHVYLSMCVNSAGDAQLANSYAMIYRNGTKTKTSHQNHASANDRASTVTIMSTLTFNGSSDYVEAYVQAADSYGTAEVLSADFSVFGAYKLIGA